jgi:hypothetical protein
LNREKIPNFFQLQKAQSAFLFHADCFQEFQPHPSAKLIFKKIPVNLRFFPENFSGTHKAKILERL